MGLMICGAVTFAVGAVSYTHLMGENRELIARNSEGANASNRDSKNREYYAVFREITGTEDTNVY